MKMSIYEALAKERKKKVKISFPTHMFDEKS